MACCSSKKITADAALCPQCSTAGQSVKQRTVKHWLVTSRVFDLPALHFCFCKRGDCPIVYFSRDGSAQYAKGEVRYPVGSIKGNGSGTLCYCFGVTEELIAEEIEKTGRSTYSSLISREARDGNCACEVRNPSGKCCLKEVKEFEEIYTLKEGRR